MIVWGLLLSNVIPHMKVLDKGHFCLCGPRFEAELRQ